MFTRRALVLLLLLIFVIVGCQTAEPETVEVPVTVEVTRVVEVPEITEVTRVVEVPVEAEVAESPNVFPSMATEVRTYNSKVNGRDYVVYVTLPLSYGAIEQSYPVIYVTDGDFYTLATAMSAGQVAFGQEMPEAITVGIGYGGSAMNSFQRREEDLTIEGSESFLQFLQEELIPDIEANYQVDPAVRTLVGHSSGGSFSLYALFNAPETFSQIVASSPPCGEACLELESAYAENHDALPVRLFVSVGALDEEILPGVELFAEALEASDYDGLEVEWPILDGETHLSARPRAFTSGMKWVFAGEAEGTVATAEESLMARTTQEVFDSHMEAIETLDIEKLMADYAEDAVLVTLDGPIMGREAILTDFFQAFLGQFPDMEITYDKIVCEGNVCLLQWTGEASAVSIPVGIGFLLIEDGQIQRQVEWFEMELKEG